MGGGNRWVGFAEKLEKQTHYSILPDSGKSGHFQNRDLVSWRRGIFVKSEGFCNELWPNLRVKTHFLRFFGTVANLFHGELSITARNFRFSLNRAADLI